LVGALGGILVVFFFFQAEDGIRDFHVTGVQTCALPISPRVLATPSKPPSARSRRANGWQTWRPSKACTSGRRSIAAYTGSCRLETRSRALTRRRARVARATAPTSRRRRAREAARSPPRLAAGMRAPNEVVNGVLEHAGGRSSRREVRTPPPRWALGRGLLGPSDHARTPSWTSHRSRADRRRRSARMSTLLLRGLRTARHPGRRPTRSGVLLRRRVLCLFTRQRSGDRGAHGSSAHRICDERPCRRRPLPSRGVGRRGQRPRPSRRASLSPRLLRRLRA